MLSDESWLGPDHGYVHCETFRTFMSKYNIRDESHPDATRWKEWMWGHRMTSRTFADWTNRALEADAVVAPRTGGLLLHQLGFALPRLELVAGGVR